MNSVTHSSPSILSEVGKWEPMSQSVRISCGSLQSADNQEVHLCVVLPEGMGHELLNI